MTHPPGDVEVSRTARRATGQAVGLGITYMFPVFLAGALSTDIRADLNLERSTFGLAVSAFFTAGAVLMPVSGMIVDRIGPRTAYRASVVLSATSLAVLGGVARTATGLALGLVLAGAAAAIGAPASSTLLVRLVPAPRQAWAFGLERAAIPFATLIAGLAVPTVARFLSWRSVFALSALAALCLLLLPLATARLVRSAGRSRVLHQPPTRRPLLLAATAFALMSAAVTPLGAFLVDFAVTRGHTPAAAGGILALGSATAIVTRLLLGWNPPTTHSMLWVAILMAGGALGFLLLVPSPGWMLMLGVLVAYGAGWGWTGMMLLAVVSAYAASPGAATGIMQSGGAVGGIAGPVLVGAVADQWSYTHAWTLLACLAALAAVILLLEPATREGAW